MTDKKLTKTQIAIEVLKANLGKPMAQVVPLLMKACDLSEKNARVCYALRVKADPTLGTIDKAPRKAAAPKAPKAKKEKAEKNAAGKPVKASATPKTKAEVLAKLNAKTPDEIAKIKAANLARMQALTAKNKPTRIAAPEGPGVENFDPAVARAEVDAILNEDSFQAPAKLTADEVRALV